MKTIALPTLFKKNANGSIQEWTIKVEGATIVTLFGQVGGAIQEARDTLTEGKGKRTAAEQAFAEAQSQWTKKKTAKGYVEDKARAEEGETDAAGGYAPMLAHRYDQRGDDIVFPAFVQPKLDGHRMTADTEGGLWSRTRKQITSLPHIAAAVKALKGFRQPLDGEAYNHAYHNRFEELTHFIRSSTPEPGFDVVQYHVYDVNMPGPFSERIAWLRKYIPADGPIKLVETLLVEGEDELMLAFERFNAAGYEGAIVRNRGGLYVGRRSADLQKLKTFLDSEYVVTGVEEGRGKLAGHAIFVCKAAGGEFRAKMKGPLEDLRQYWLHPERAIGKQLTVKYQGLTKYGIPRFPVAWRFAPDPF